VGARFYIERENATEEELRVSKRCAPTQQGFVRLQAKSYIPTRKIASGLEQIWKVLKDRFFANWIAKSPQVLIERICSAIQSLLPDEISSIASIDHLVQ